MAWKRIWDWLLRRRAPQQPEPDGDELLRPLRKLAKDQGRSLDDVTYELLAHSLAQQVPASRPERSWPTLSHREQDVAALIYAGYTPSQIAQLLNVGLETVRTHVQRIMRKCGVHSKVELCIALEQEGAERRIHWRLEELLNPPPGPGAKG
jgi:DNA-binding CsgD family transcriptional regulator